MTSKLWPSFQYFSISLTDSSLCTLSLTVHCQAFFNQEELFTGIFSCNTVTPGPPSQAPQAVCHQTRQVSYSGWMSLVVPVCSRPWYEARHVYASSKPPPPPTLGMTQAVSCSPTGSLALCPKAEHSP